MIIMAYFEYVVQNIERIEKIFLWGDVTKVLLLRLHSVNVMKKVISTEIDKLTRDNGK